MVSGSFVPAALLAACAIVIPRPACAQLPERIQRCLPYPQLAEEIVAMYPAPPEKQYFLDEIRFDGDTKLSASDMKSIAAELKHPSAFTEPDWYDEVAEIAQQLWGDYGYFRAQATSSAIKLSEDSVSEHDAVVVHVNAGRQYRVGEIRIVSADGDEPLAIPAQELRELVHLQKGEVFNLSKLREAFHLLNRRYARVGYIDTTSQPNFDFNEEEGVIDLTLRIDQQRQFRVKEVHTAGVNAEMETNLRAVTPVGEPFDYEKILAFIDANRARLPAIAGNGAIQVKRDVRNATVIVNFEFDAFAGCPSGAQ